MLVFLSIFIFNPFVSPFPLPFDLQPISLLLIFILAFLNKNIILIDKFKLILLLLGGCSIFYIDPGVSPFFSIKGAGLLVFLCYFVFLPNFLNRINIKICLGNTVFLLCGCLLQRFEPDFFREVSGFLLSRTSEHAFNISGRGVAGFSPEPAFTAILVAVNMYVSIIFREIQGSNINRVFLINSLLCFLILILTRSGTGMIFLIFFGLYFYFQFMVNRVVVSLLLLLLSLFVGSVFDVFLLENLFGRGFDLMNMLANDLESFKNDGSVGQRVGNIVTGLFVLIEQPFGFGANGYATAPFEMNRLWGWYDWFDVPVLKGFVSGGMIAVAQYGWFFVVTCSLLFWYVVANSWHRPTVLILGLTIFVLILIGGVSLAAPFAPMVLAALLVGSREVV